MFAVGVSWVPAAANGTLGPARSLRVSFRGIIELIANALHNSTAPKVHARKRWTWTYRVRFVVVYVRTAHVCVRVCACTVYVLSIVVVILIACC